MEVGGDRKERQEKMVHFSLLVSILGLKGFKAFIFTGISKINIEIIVFTSSKVQRCHISRQNPGRQV